ncbi:MAG: hypothetical protein Q8M22_04970, partial [Actinomycetota bacterium]|nr:hypothetical protein [Actinomycetota bacterium]
SDSPSLVQHCASCRALTEQTTEAIGRVTRTSKEPRLSAAAGRAHRRPLTASSAVRPYSRSVAGAAALYALYHVGYGMGADEMVFLFGLGVVYAIAFRLVRNVLVVWPLLTPLGAFFNNLDSGDIDLPWASMIGFGEVGVAMVAVIWLAHRHERRRERAAATSQEIALVGSD